jgi:Immunity protein 26
MKTPKHEPGAFLRIPLPDGTFAYGRHLEDPYTAFYDYRTWDPSTDLTTIEKQPVLFRLPVRTSSLKKWERIGAKELKGQVAEPVVAFHQEIGDFRKCIIFDTIGNERAATPEECIGLERDAVWDAHHIEQRLLDTFEGRPNAEEQRLRVRLK